MITLYPTGWHYDAKGIAKNIPVYADEDGELWIKLDLDGTPVVRNLVSFNGESIRSMALSSIQIGLECDSNFHICEVSYSKLASNDLDLSVSQEYNVAETKHFKRQVKSVFDRLQNNIETLRNEVVNLTCRNNNLKSDISRLERRLDEQESKDDY